MPEKTIAAFEDHGTVARTIDEEADEAELRLQRLEEIGVSMTDVGRALEEQGVALFRTKLRPRSRNYSKHRRRAFRSRRCRWCPGCPSRARCRR